MSLTFDIRTHTPRPSPSSALAACEHSLPASELCETSDGFELLIDLPGITQENLTITIDNGVLHLNAKRDGSLPGNPIVRESQSSDFTREFRLGSTIDTSAISALLENGLLRLRVPKLPQSKLRHIPLMEHETN